MDNWWNCRPFSRTESWTRWTSFRRRYASGRRRTSTSRKRTPQDFETWCCITRWPSSISNRKLLSRWHRCRHSSDRVSHLQNLAADDAEKKQINVDPGLTDEGELCHLKIL